MNGQTKVLIPNYSRKESSETVLSNSQSPSFAIFRASPEVSDKSDDEIQIIQEVRFREEKKRPLPKTPYCQKTKQPTPKRLKEETVIRPKTGAEGGDYGCQIRENEKRIKAITGLHIDLLEMYSVFCSSASQIPLPHTLLPKDNEQSSSRNFSIEDRKRVLLKIFGSRSKLKVSPETLHLGAAILDKCLDKMTVSKDTLGELAAVSVAIASKIEDVNCLTLGNLLDTNLIENRPVSMIASLERLVLISLSYKVTIPTPLNFATYMLVHLSAPKSKRDLAHYFLELSILYVHNRLFLSDVISYSATCLAFVMETEPGKSVSRVLRETELELRVFADKNYLEKRKKSREVMRTMIDLFIVAPTENHSIFREYSTPNRSKVALRRVDPSLQELLRIDSN